MLIRYRSFLFNYEYSKRRSKIHSKAIFGSIFSFCKFSRRKNNIGDYYGRDLSMSPCMSGNFREKKILVFLLAIKIAMTAFSMRRRRNSVVSELGNRFGSHESRPREG